MNENKKNMVFIRLNKPENLGIEKRINFESTYFITIQKENGEVSLEEIKGEMIINYIPVLYFFIHRLLERKNSGIDSLRNIDSNVFVQMFSSDIKPLKPISEFSYIWHFIKFLRIIEVIIDNQPSMSKKSSQAYYFKLVEPYYSAKTIQHEIVVNAKTDDLSKRFKKAIFSSIFLLLILTLLPYYHNYF